jgi:hypothetical protein
MTDEERENRQKVRSFYDLNDSSVELVHQKLRIMENEELLRVLKQDVKSWNAWRGKTYPHQVPDFTGADLSGIDLRGADLRRLELPESNLQGANLSGADFYRTTLWRANLSDANLTRADLSSTNLNGADLQRSDLSGAILRFSRLTAANVSGAIFSDCFVYGCSFWNLKGMPAKQSGVVITPQTEPVITVDSIEVAQFVYLLLKNPKIRDVIDTLAKKAVLILGRFTAERKAVLEKVREGLRQNGYVPILFDFDKPSTRDTQETIATLAGLSRFVIADISDPKSVPQELISIVPNFPSVLVQPILQIGYEPWGMYDHIQRYPWVLPVFVYENEQILRTALEDKIIAPADAKARELLVQRAREIVEKS